MHAVQHTGKPMQSVAAQDLTFAEALPLLGDTGHVRRVGTDRASGNALIQAVVVLNRSKLVPRRARMYVPHGLAPGKRQ